MVKSPILEKQKKELEKEQLACRILQSARNELSLKLKYFDLALGSLPLAPAVGGAENRPGPLCDIHPAGTDGAVLVYTADDIFELYMKGRNFCARLYLHVIFHCLFGHPFDRKDRGEDLWNLSCDIASEALIDSLNLKCAHIRTGAYRKSVYAELKSQLAVLSAEGIYARLKEMNPDGDVLCRLRQEFFLDSHALWGRNDSKNTGLPDENRRRWEDIRDRMETELSLYSHERSEGEGELLEQLNLSARPRYDYREFLRKFMVLREEMQVDPDSFDYIFYNYGMTLYGNMPLIEPLETREIKGVEELVIVIDTSMSTSGDLVRRFLEETFHLLEEEGTFFKHFRIHILQCDEKVQSDECIKSREEAECYMRRFTLKGGGGTDFRPAFAYVDKMMAEKAYSRLKGLLYFTDGYGVFPAKMPVYETAFIFVKNHYQDVDVPPWAIKLILGEGDFYEH